jgi:hypothetical protein
VLLLSTTTEARGRVYKGCEGGIYLYGPVRNVFDAGRSFTWASERGLGPANLDFFGP